MARTTSTIPIAFKGPRACVALFSGLVRRSDCVRNLVPAYQSQPSHIGNRLAWTWRLRSSFAEILERPGWLKTLWR
jgi:hypothetical protein